MQTRELIYTRHFPFMKKSGTLLLTIERPENPVHSSREIFQNMLNVSMLFFASFAASREQAPLPYL